MYPTHHPIEIARPGIASGGYMTAAILADYFDDNTEWYGNEISALANVLRQWMDVQMNVRTSPERKAAFDAEVDKLNQLFVEVPDRREIESISLRPRATAPIYAGFFSDRIGPYYRHLTIVVNYLDQHIELLDQEPLRALTLLAARDPDMLASILRNYRIANIETLNLNWAIRADTKSWITVMHSINGPSLKQINITERMNAAEIQKVTGYFYTAPNIRRGCKLNLVDRTYTK